VSGTVKVFGAAVLMMATIVALGRVAAAVKRRRRG
jgi:hypothetical protein